MNLKFAWSRDNLPCCLFPFAPYKSWTSFRFSIHLRQAWICLQHQYIPLNQPHTVSTNLLGRRFITHMSPVFWWPKRVCRKQRIQSHRTSKRLPSWGATFLSSTLSLSLSPSLSPPQELWAISKFISTSSASCTKLNVPPETNMELKISCYRSVSSSMEKCSSSILFFRSGSMTPCTAPLAPRAKARQPSVPLQHWAPTTSEYMCSRVSTITYA